MSWRRVPPVMSPIAAAALPRAAFHALRRHSTHHVEALLAQLFNARRVVLTDSGTSALVLALRATVQRGAVVAMPAYACIDLVTAAIGSEVRIAFYDTLPETLAPDPESIRAVLKRGTRALLVTPLYGYPPDMLALQAIARESGVPLIEDAAQGAGATVSGRRLGSFGSVSVLSFGRGKGTTAGSGGALLVHDSGLLPRVDELRKTLTAPYPGTRDLLVLAAQWVFARPTLYALPSALPFLQLGEMVYHPPRPPAHMARSALAMLPVAMNLEAAELTARQQLAAQYAEAVRKGNSFRSVEVPADGVGGFLRFALLDTGGSASPDRRIGALRGYPVTLDEHPATRAVLEDVRIPLQGAGRLRDRLFTLPTHSRVCARDVCDIVDWLMRAR